MSFDDAGWVEPGYSLESVDVLGENSAEDIVSLEEKKEVMCGSGLELRVSHGLEG